MFIFYLPPIDRRIEKEDLTSYVEKKREMFLLQVRLVHYEELVSQISSAHFSILLELREMRFKSSKRLPG